MGWDALFDFLGAGGGLLILLQWLSGIPRRRLELKRDREKTFRELLDDDMEQMNELMELYKTLQDENIQIQNRVSALERVVLLIEGCPTYIVACSPPRARLQSTILLCTHGTASHGTEGSALPP